MKRKPTTRGVVWALCYALVWATVLLSVVHALPPLSMFAAAYAAVGLARVARTR